MGSMPEFPFEEVFLAGKGKKKKNIGRRVAVVGTPECSDLRVGSSEIGSCPAKVILSKFYPREYGLQQEFIFERGDWVESWLEERFERANLAVITQEQIDDVDLLMRANIDFIVELDGIVYVIECKSTDGLPSAPYDSHIDQTFFQLRLKNKKMVEEGDIRPLIGYVLYIDPNKGTYKPFRLLRSEETDAYIERRALAITNVLRLAMSGELVIPSPEKTFMCDFCPYIMNFGEEGKACPAFEVFEDVMVDMPEDAKVLLFELEELKQQSKMIENLIDAKKASLKNLARNISSAGWEGMLTEDNEGQKIRTRVINKKRNSFDKTKLKQEDPEAFAFLARLEEKYFKTTEWTELDVSPVKTKRRKTNGE